MEKTEILNKNIEMKRKYAGIPEEVWNRFELVHSISQLAFQDIPNNQVKSEENSHDTKGNVKRLVKMTLL